MEKKIDLSVVITVYNIEKYIGECIDSVLDDKGINIEVILVNDASTDSSLEICKQYAKHNDGIVVIENEVNKGITASRNAGLRAAKGEYVYVIDGDDLVVQGSCTSMYRICKENNLDLLEFSADVFYESDDMKQYCSDEEYYIQKYMLNQVESGPALFAQSQKNYDARWGNSCLRCIRTELLQSKGLYFVEGLRYADGSGFHLYMAAERAMVIPDVFYSRRVRNNSQVTSTPKFYYLESLIILFIEELKIWDTYAFPEKINRGIECYFRRTNRQIKDLYQQFKGRNNDYSLFLKHPAARYYYEYNIKEKSLCVDFITKEEAELYKSKDIIYIYGAGFYASQLSDVFDYYGINYEYIVTDKTKNPETVRNKVVHGISDMTFLPDDVVFIAISAIHQASIVENLENKGLKDWKQFVF